MILAKRHETHLCQTQYHTILGKQKGAVSDTVRHLPMCAKAGQTQA